MQFTPITYGAKSIAAPSALRKNNPIPTTSNAVDTATFSTPAAKSDHAVLFAGNLRKPTALEALTLRLPKGALIEEHNGKKSVVHGKAYTERYRQEHLERQIEKHETQLEQLKRKQIERTELHAAAQAIKKKHRIKNEEATLNKQAAAIEKKKRDLRA